ncbi:DUF2500 domain-containing protein [Paenibacillus sp. KN14-4R]|uniref:DUF2500 domain-containing protein n=1 Tax=Paenibacillus sp. KN14-4R TaxID=3445773 RepID=UPI003F9F79D2
MHSDRFGEEDGFGFFSFLGNMPLFFRFFFIIIFLAVVSTFAYMIFKSIKTYLSNNAAELLTRPCKVVDKRTKVSGGSGESSASTDYFITFEFEDGSRVELPIRTNQYGMIVVGDHGELTYQGTRFKSFNRMMGK